VSRHINYLSPYRERVRIQASQNLCAMCPLPPPHTMMCSLGQAFHCVVVDGGSP
jgi:hypothetical protein